MSQRNLSLSDGARKGSRRVRRLLYALCAAALALAVLPGASVSARQTSVRTPVTDPVTEAGSALAEATASRVAAETHLADAVAHQAAVRSELEDLADGAAAVTREIAQAKAALREYAVTAFIDGGAASLATVVLDPGERAEIAWHDRLVGSTAADAAEAVDRYNALKAANEPRIVAAAARLDRANQEVDAAYFDAVLAAGHERDAEAALAAAQVEAQRQAVEAQRQAVEERAATAGSATSVHTPRSARPQGRAGNADAAPAATPDPAGLPASDGITATAAETATLARIRRCESRGNYSIVSASGRYRGAYQFDRRTWAGVGGSGDPAAASPAEQDMRALMLLRKRGTRPWPNCG